MVHSAEVRSARLPLFFRFAPPACLLMIAATAFATPPGDRHRPPRAQPPPHAAGPLAVEIPALLADGSAQGAAWAISVTGLDGTPLYALHDDVHVAPASNAKLFTTAAAFAILPQSLTLETRVIAQGAITDGTLNGDLVLQGTGDPSLSGRVLPYSARTERTGDPLAALDTFAAQVAATGLHRVTGGVIGDDTAFVYEPYPLGWEWNDLQWEEGAPVSALTVNDNVVYLAVLPGAGAGEPLQFNWLPQTAYYTIESTARTVASSPGGKASIGIERLPGTRVVRIWGTLPAGSTGVHVALAVDDSAAFAAEALRERLLAHGVAVAGAATARHLRKTTLPPTPGGTATETAAAENSEQPGSPQFRAQAEGEVLARRNSPPLGEDLMLTNKVSQNLHAELLLMQLGAAGNASSSTPAVAATRGQGLAAERRVFARAGIAPGDVLFRDGSGVSAEDMVTARSVTALLRFAGMQPWGAAYRATLPVGGVDGTLAGRFSKPPLRGVIQAKTGTLSETASLSGYLTAKSGKIVTFSILCDKHLPGAAARTMIDRIVAAIYAAE